jgi:hypothetical protein
MMGYRARLLLVQLGVPFEPPGGLVDEVRSTGEHGW